MLLERGTGEKEGEEIKWAGVRIKIFSFVKNHDTLSQT